MKVGNPIIYGIATWTMSLVMRCLGGYHGRGMEMVPKNGPLIIASIHLSYLDPCLLAATCKHRKLVAMAKEDLWKNKLLGATISGIGAFPVRRGEGDMESMRTAISVLETGQCLLLFPEGTRGDGVHIQPMARGVAVLAKKTGAVVVPVGIHGTQIALPREGKPRRHPMRAVYGKPFTYAEIATGSTERENRDLFSRHLQSELLQLCAEAGLVLKSGESSSQSPVSPDHAPQSAS